RAPGGTCAAPSPHSSRTSSTSTIATRSRWSRPSRRAGRSSPRAASSFTSVGSAPGAVPTGSSRFPRRSSGCSSPTESRVTPWSSCMTAWMSTRSNGRRYPGDSPAGGAGAGRGRGGASAESERYTRSSDADSLPAALHRGCHGARSLGRVQGPSLDCRAMIYVCVPVHNEARTVGLVLWKVRQVFTAFEREYQIIACDDASTDGSADVLASYARVLPLTVIHHPSRQGYAKSLEELLRVALQRTDRPKRDCAITLHADFVHAPETMEEMVKRLESGADLVVAEQYRAQGTRSWPERWARQWAPRLLRVGVGVKDSISGFLALRLVVLRQATRNGAASPLLATEGWAANAELLARLGANARRIEVVSSAARYDLKQRPSRSNPWQQLLAAWRARSLISAARKAATMVVLALLAATGALGAQDHMCTGNMVSAVPFPVGERLSFNAKYGIFNVGSAAMEVMGIDNVYK